MTATLGFWLAELTLAPPRAFGAVPFGCSIAPPRSVFSENRWVELARARHPARILMSERVSQFRTVWRNCLGEGDRA